MQSIGTPLSGLVRGKRSFIAAVIAGSAALLLLGATRISHAEEVLTHAAQHAPARLQELQDCFTAMHHQLRRDTPALASDAIARVIQA